MKINNIILLVTVIGFIFCTSSFAQDIKIKTGIEVLKNDNFKQLRGKRVGLITNPTGVDDNLRSTIDILHEANGVELVALYGPEHGVRGDVHAETKYPILTIRILEYLSILCMVLQENQLLKCLRGLTY